MSVRVVSVGNAMTTEVALDSDVRVLDGFTLVRERTGHIVRLIERDGRVIDAPMDNAETNHARALFGIDHE